MELVNPNTTGQCRTYLDAWKRISESGYHASAGMQTGIALSSQPAVLIIAKQSSTHTHMTMTLREQTQVLSTSAL